jgi:hypothetical protein
LPASLSRGPENVTLKRGFRVSRVDLERLSTGKTGSLKSEPLTALRVRPVTYWNRFY